jgi:hypothetical protein
MKSSFLFSTRRSSYYRRSISALQTEEMADARSI